LSAPEPFNLCASDDSLRREAHLSCIFIIRCEPTAHGPLSQVFLWDVFGV
jgi:hypothetical protein